MVVIPLRDRIACRRTTRRSEEGRTGGEWAESYRGESGWVMERWTMGGSMSSESRWLACTDGELLVNIMETLLILCRFPAKMLNS
jgi:hypothetical protein